MPKYLTGLWDEHALIAHKNAHEFVRALDADAPDKIAAYVWQTVKAIRAGRKSFFETVHRDAEERKKTKVAKAAAKAAREAKKSGPPSGGSGPPPGSDAPPSSAPPTPSSL